MGAAGSDRPGCDMRKEMRDLVQSAIDQGFTVIQKKNGVMLRSPGGRGTYMIHGTPSDHRARKNAERGIARALREDEQ